jgi:DNA primase
MPPIPRHIVDAVRERVDIAEIIQKHVRLERRRNGWWGLCPFHQEKSGSFHVIPERHMYYCFGCQEGGDVFRFLMRVEGVSFAEAVRELASAAGVEIPERELSPEERRALRQRATLYDVLEAACRFFENTLWTKPEGEPGRAYFTARALTPEAQRRARVGYAPRGWRNLCAELQRQGFERELLLAAGLAREGDEGSIYDLFRERVMFPIRDDRNRVIAFGGRILQSDGEKAGAKYVNTPETALYEKSKALYGLDMARTAIRKQGRVLVVEGYFDVLSLHQAGFEEAIATCGTALTEDHLVRIRRLTEDIVVLLDADEAGTRAAARVLPMMLGAQLMPWRLQLPNAKDPDELIRTEGASAMTAALEHKEPLLEWYINHGLSRRGWNDVNKERLLAELRPLLHVLPNAALSRVAAQLGASEVELRRLATAAAPATAPKAEPPPAWKPRRELTHVLWLLIHRYAQCADLFVRGAIPDLIDTHAPVHRVLARLATGEPVAAVIADTPDIDVTRTLSAVVAKSDLYAEEAAAMAMAELLESFVAARRDAQLQRLMAKIEQAGRTGDLPALRAASADRQRLVDRRQAIRRALAQKDVAEVARLLEAEVTNEFSETT